MFVNNFVECIVEGEVKVVLFVGIECFGNFMKVFG